jgi:hypothetical protein
VTKYLSLNPIGSSEYVVSIYFRWFYFLFVSCGTDAFERVRTGSEICLIHWTLNWTFGLVQGLPWTLNWTSVLFSKVQVRTLVLDQTAETLELQGALSLILNSVCPLKFLISEIKKSNRVVGKSATHSANDLQADILLWRNLLITNVWGTTNGMIRIYKY